MRTQLVEATNDNQNWGKFLVARFDGNDWSVPSGIGDSPRPLLSQCGWGPSHRLVVDLQTGEGAIVSPGGSAHADLAQHAVWVCPLFEPFLAWWYDHWPLVDVGSFPAVVQLPDAEFQQYGYRRSGGKETR